MSRIDSSAAIIGGGTMGADIAVVFASGGWTVHIAEPAAETRKKLPVRFRTGLQQLKSEDTDDRFSIHAHMEKIPWKTIDFVVECVPEDLAIKQTVFKQLEALSPVHIPLTSNSSSFPISLIGKGLATQARMAGLHFFMPAHLVPLVEVIRSEFTEPAVAEQIGTVMGQLGKRSVQVRRDIPGFLANRIQHAMMREAISLVERGIAKPEDVDAAVHYGFGFRFLAGGPLFQKDLSGVDIHCTAAAGIYPDLCNAASPSPYITEMTAAGHLGVKAKKGFYTWTDEKITREKARYEKVLLEALEILNKDGQELP